MEPVRLQKHLARAGVASRRGAEAVIEAGRVTVNGEVVRELGTKVDPEHDHIEVDGQPIAIEPTRWVALNKPRGYVCTRRDPQGRRTVYDLLPDDMGTLFTVGRLDADSEGLILLTNDGDAANRLLHPRYGVRREYLALVEGKPGPKALRRLRAGVDLEDGPARAVDAGFVDTEEGPAVRLVLVEGRKREVRRMLSAVGHPVRRLTRVRYHGLELGALRPGAWRLLDADELGRVGGRGVPTED